MGGMRTWWFPDTSHVQSIMLGQCASRWPRQVYVVLQGRPYTREFSVSGATLSAQTFLCFFPE